MENKNVIVRFLVLILVAVIGVILVIWGTKTTNSVLISVGASLACVGISLIIDALLTKDVAEILREFTTSKFLSEEEVIKNYRKKYYGYWVSRIDNVTYWLHAVLDFSNNTTPGRLKSEFDIKTSKSNYCHEYCCEAVLRGDKLIFIITAKKGTEPPSGGVMPFGRNYSETSYGIHIHESYDNEQVMTPFIFSLSPIDNWVSNGEVNNESVSNHLWELWRKNFKLYV